MRVNNNNVTYKTAFQSKADRPRTGYTDRHAICYCDLDLEPIADLDIRIRARYSEDVPTCIRNALSRSRLANIRVLQTNTHTHTHGQAGATANILTQQSRCRGCYKCADVTHAPNLTEYPVEKRRCEKQRCRAVSRWTESRDFWRRLVEPCGVTSRRRVFLSQYISRPSAAKD